MPSDDTTNARRGDFIRDMVEEDLASGKYGARVATRFPPEPNGYLHIGHAKSICLNFGIAEQYGGHCNLRFDDTNPATEDPEYVASIQDDIRWLGYDWGEGRYFASDYFERLYEFAIELIERGKAYVDSSSEEEIRRDRGTVTEPGRESPYRDRGIEENLDLFRRMRACEFADGEHVLRARIDMSAANMKMRDPLLYRIRHAHHYRRGDDWCLYPMYDFAHCLSDALEGITHSLCTLEFENNREIYDWVLDNTSVDRPPPEQTEFARLNLSYTVLSKRKLLELVEGGFVEGWDDPRMPTLSGLRRRGYTPESIRAFCDAIGVAKANSVVDVAQLEHAVRSDLNQRAPRLMAVLDPLPVVITNYPEGDGESIEAPYFPADIGREGSRRIPFSRNLLIERADFMDDPPKGYKRMTPGREIRLRYGYVVRCDESVRDPDTGEIVEVRCTYDQETRGGSTPDGRRVEGTIHWVSRPHSVEFEARLYDRLFRLENPSPSKADGADFKESLNEDSLAIVGAARAEPALATFPPGSHVQFERLGYFHHDGDADSELPVWNRTVGLRDTWTKRAQQEAQPAAPPRVAKPRTGPEGAPPPLSDEEATVSAELSDTHSLRREDAERLARDPASLELFEATVGEGADPRSVATWVLNELRTSTDAPAISPIDLATLLDLVDTDRISGKIAKEVLAESLETGASPAEIVERRGLEQISDPDALAEIVDRILTEHPEQLAAFRSGKIALRGFFVGQVMKATGGRANPRLLQGVLDERLAAAD